MTTKGKGVFHLALAVASVAEMFISSTKVRRALLGGCAGYHLHAAVYHFFLEPYEPKEVEHKFGGPYTFPNIALPKNLTFGVSELDNYPCTAAEEVAQLCDYDVPFTKKKRKKRTKGK